MLTGTRNDYTLGHSLSGRYSLTLAVMSGEAGNRNRASGTKVSVTKVGPQQSMFKGVVTSPLHGVRFVMSTNVPLYRVAAHSCSITPILSDGCLATTELSGGVEMIVKNSNAGDTSNPFNLFSTVAYKLRAAAAILNPSAGVHVATHDIA